MIGMMVVVVVVNNDKLEYSVSDGRHWKCCGRIGGVFKECLLHRGEHEIGRSQGVRGVTGASPEKEVPWTEVRDTGRLGAIPCSNLKSEVEQ